MMVVGRIAFFRSFFSHMHCCNCCNMYMVIGSWASLRAHIHVKKRKKERKRKEKKRREKKLVDSGARRRWCKEERKKKNSKIVRATLSTTDNVDYHHNRHTYVYYNTYAALVSLDE